MVFDYEKRCIYSLLFKNIIILFNSIQLSLEFSSRFPRYDAFSSICPNLPWFSWIDTKYGGRREVRTKSVAKLALPGSWDGNLIVHTRLHHHLGGGGMKPISDVGWSKKDGLVFKEVLPSHQYMYNYAILLIDTLSYIV